LRNAQHHKCDTSKAEHDTWVIHFALRVWVFAFMQDLAAEQDGGNGKWNVDKEH
jgi:hypothetical protein